MWLFVQSAKKVQWREGCRSAQVSVEWEKEFGGVTGVLKQDRGKMCLGKMPLAQVRGKTRTSRLLKGLLK